MDCPQLTSARFLNTLKGKNKDVIPENLIKLCEILPTSDLCSGRVINMWNKLDCDTVCLPSLNIFKNRLERLHMHKH